MLCIVQVKNACCVMFVVCCVWLVCALRVARFGVNVASVVRCVLCVVHVGV